MKKLSLIVIALVVLLIAYVFNSFNHSSLKVSASDEIVTDKEHSGPESTEEANESSEQLLPTSLEQNRVPKAVEQEKPAEFNDDIGALECVTNIAFDNEEYEHEIGDYFSSLADAEGKEQQLLYTLFSPAEDDKKSKQLVDYIESGNLSGSEIVALNAIASCTNALETHCDEKFLNQVVQYDSQNGVMWFYQSLAYLRLGNEQAAIAAIAEVPKSPFFNARMGEEALLYAEALNQSERDKFSINAFAGFQQAMMRVPFFSGLTNWCKNETNEMAIANACLTIGRELSERSTLTIDNMIGFSLQESAYSWLQDDAALADIQAKRDSTQQINADDSFFVTSIMIMLDERLARRWLTLVDNYGEYETQQILNKEAKELYQNDQNLICSTIYDLLN